MTTLDKMRQKQQNLGVAPPTPPAPPPPKPAAKEQHQQPAPKGKGGRRFPEMFRLPGGSEFRASYDADKQLWTVTLAVPGLPTIETTGGSVHAALIFLGRQWYDWHGREAQAPPATA